MGTGVNTRPGQDLAVVVGAGAMGMAVARRLGASYRVLLADRDADHVERQVAAMCSEGHHARGVACDVTDPDAVRQLAVLAAEWGPPRALAHVVGLSPSMAEAETILRVNLNGACLVADAFLELVRPGSAALFFASVAGHQPEVTAEITAALAHPLAADFMARLAKAIHGDITPVLAYQLSKAGVIAMCQRQATSWGARGARIMSISPGPIATTQGALELERQPGKRRLLEQLPLQREGSMLEIADAVEFLLSDRASFVTGADLLVDGGAVSVMRRW